MMRVGIKEVLTAWLREDGCEVSFQSVTGKETPSILFVRKEGKKSWFLWRDVLEAWQNGLSVKAIAKRIAAAKAGKGEVI